MLDGLSSDTTTSADVCMTIMELCISSDRVAVINLSLLGFNRTLVVVVVVVLSGTQHHDGNACWFTYLQISVFYVYIYSAGNIEIMGLDIKTLHCMYDKS